MSKFTEEQKYECLRVSTMVTKDASGYEKSACRPATRKCDIVDRDTEHVEYELIDIAFELLYDLPEDGDVVNVCEEDQMQELDTHVIEFDEDGIPLGQSKEEIKIRERIIRNFFNSFQKGCDDRRVFNQNLQSDILIRMISAIEAIEHSSKSYRSTKAVLEIEQVLKNARPVRRVAVKVGNNNQRPFAYMLVMVYELDNIGTIKLTVGVKKSSGERIEYGISALPEGESIIDNLRHKNR